MNQRFLLLNDYQARLATIFADQKLRSCHRGHYLRNSWRSLLWLIICGFDLFLILLFIFVLLLLWVRCHIAAGWIVVKIQHWLAFHHLYLDDIAVVSCFVDFLAVSTFILVDVLRPHLCLLIRYHIACSAIQYFMLRLIVSWAGPLHHLLVLGGSEKFQWLLVSLTNLILLPLWCLAQYCLFLLVVSTVPASPMIVLDTINFLVDARGFR